MYIGLDAFYGCIGLTSVYVLDETPFKFRNLDGYYGNLSDVFGNYDATLYVPQGSLARYQEASVWRNFANIVEFNATAIENVTEDAPVFEVTAGGILLTAAEGKVVAVYTTNGALVEKIDSYAGEEIMLDKGVYIICVGGKAVKVKL